MLATILVVSLHSAARGQGSGGSSGGGGPGGAADRTLSDYNADRRECQRQSSIAEGAIRNHIGAVDGQGAAILADVTQRTRDFDRIRALTLVGDTRAEGIAMLLPPFAAPAPAASPPSLPNLSHCQRYIRGEIQELGRLHARAVDHRANVDSANRDMENLRLTYVRFKELFLP
jgi:hypothetical protein